MDCSLPSSSVHGILQARILEWIAIPFSPGTLPNPMNKPRSPTLKVYSLPSEPPGKLMKTGVGSLSFLQETFLTQGSNWGLRHCRQILYQLSYQGSPYLCLNQVKIFTFANEPVESNITTIPFLLLPSHAQIKSTRVLQ